MGVYRPPPSCRCIPLSNGWKSQFVQIDSQLSSSNGKKKKKKKTCIALGFRFSRISTGPLSLSLSLCTLIATSNLELLELGFGDSVLHERIRIRYGSRGISIHFHSGIKVQLWWCWWLLDFSLMHRIYLIGCLARIWLSLLLWTNSGESFMVLFSHLRKFFETVGS